MAMRRTVSNATYVRQGGERDLTDVVFDSCTFDNCRVRGGTFAGVEFRQARVWSCGLDRVVLRDCTVDGLRMTTGSGRGGKTMPLIVHGVLAHRVTLKGSIGSLIWNPPGSFHDPMPEDEAVRLATAFYDDVDDFALDISEAEFTAFPSLRYGPPGHLVRRDPATQPLIRLEEARRVLELEDAQLGIWATVLSGFVRSGWPESRVLVPALRAPKQQREQHAAAMARLRAVAELT